MASKRPAAAPASSGRPKKSKDAAVNGKIATVKKAVLTAEGYPESVVQMVAGALPQALSVYKEGRHYSQTEVVKMAKQILRTSLEKKEAKLSEIRTSYDEVQVVQSNKDAVVEDAKKLSESKAEALHEAKAAVVEAVDAEAAAQSALADAQMALVPFESITEEKEAFEAKFNGEFALVKEGTAENLEEVIEALLSFAEDYSFEADLLTSASAAFKKAPGKRGDFDKMVLDQFEGEMTARLEKISKELDAMAEPQAVVESCQAAVDAGKVLLQTKKDELATALESQRDAQAATKAATKEAQATRPAVKALQETNNALAMELLDFQEAFKTFEELEELAPPPEPKEPENDEPTEAEKALEADAAREAAAASA